MSKILVVDDDPHCRTLLLTALQGEGHIVCEAKNGVEALDIYALFNPDLVLLDLFMPEKDGIETILDLRRRVPAFRVIFMTNGGSIGMDSQLDDLALFGTCGSLKKPFGLETLVTTVSQALAKPMTATRLPYPDLRS